MLKHLRKRFFIQQGALDIQKKGHQQIELLKNNQLNNKKRRTEVLLHSTDIAKQHYLTKG